MVGLSGRNSIVSQGRSVPLLVQHIILLFDLIPFLKLNFKFNLRKYNESNNC